MKIFVTGASGTLGSRAVDRLLRAGHDVTALVRSDGARVRLERAGARAVQGSLFDPEALRTALAGHDAAVNLATHIPSAADAIKPGAWREDDRIRTEGSRVLAGAALAAGVGRLVQEAVSFVYPDSGDSWITEQTQPAPNLKSQAATMAATATVTRFAALGGVGVVLRFGLLYGPDRNSREMLARARAGKPVVLGKPAGWLSPVHPEDAARAVAAALACDSGTYNVCETPVLRSDWAAAIGRAARAEATAGTAAKFYPRCCSGWPEPAASRSPAPTGSATRPSARPPAGVRTTTACAAGGRTARQRPARRRHPSCEPYPAPHGHQYRSGRVRPADGTVVGGDGLHRRRNLITEIDFVAKPRNRTPAPASGKPPPRKTHRRKTT